jgi:hypothetical protein
MKQNVFEIARTVLAALRPFFELPSRVLIRVFRVLARPMANQPTLTWLLMAVTLAAFAGEGLNDGLYKAVSAPVDFWLSLGLWLFVCILGSFLSRRAKTAGLSLERRQWAATVTAGAQLAWLGLTALIWWINSGKFGVGSPAPVHGLLASLLLLPSFSLNLVLLQRGLRDSGFEADVILVNKSGTLTIGRRKLKFIQRSVNSPLKNKDAVLAFAAGLETEGEDDLAEAIRERAKRLKITPIELKDVMRIAGVGVSGRLEGSRVVLGGPAQLVSQNVSIDVADLVRADQANTQGQTVLYLLIDGELCGYIGFADQVRRDVKFFIHLLQYRRKRVIVYSGDAHETTKFVATELDCDAFFGEVLPHEYETLLEKISSDGSVILQSQDLAATALQIERAVRDRRLQWLMAIVSLGVPAVGLAVATLKLAANVRPSLLLPAVDTAFGLTVAAVLAELSIVIWQRVPAAITNSTIEDEVEDD